MEESPGPDLDRAGEGNVVPFSGEDDDSAVRALLAEPAGGLQPIQVGHPKIHQHDVGLVVDRGSDGVVPSIDHPHDAEVAFLVERDLQRLAERAVIVGDDHGDGIVQRDRVAVRFGAGHRADGRPGYAAFRVGSGAISVVPQRGDSR